MKEKTKKDIKEWIQLIAMAGVAGLIVMQLNGFVTPSESKPAKPSERKTEKADSVAPQRDSVITMTKAHTR